MGDVLKIALGALGGIVLVLLFGVFSGGGMGPMMGYGMMGGGILGMLSALLFWVLAVAVLAGILAWAITRTQRR
jgi:hypothetical protein